MSAETPKPPPQADPGAAPEVSRIGKPESDAATFVPAATVDFSAPAPVDHAAQDAAPIQDEAAPERVDNSARDHWHDKTGSNSEITDLQPDWLDNSQSEPWPRSGDKTPETADGDGGGKGPGQPPATGTEETSPVPAPEQELHAGDNPVDAAENDIQKPMTLMDHLSELRVRLVRCLLGAAVGFLLCYGISELLFKWLAMPLVAVMPQDAKLMFTSVPEGFFVYLKVAFVAGLFVASPYLFYQVWAFVAPGLYQEEKKTALPLAFCSAFFFLLGASFCYFLVFPYAFTFFMSYSNDFIVAMPSIDEYLSFSLKMLLAFGLIFEMPLFAFFLARMGIITADWMRSIRRYAILAVFIVAAILTPPDVISQLLMAIPMLILYEVSIFVAQAAGRKKKAASTEPSSGETGGETP